ncbi:hypothetical protein [Marvinbryantia formatexigens]|nr:hypothetical protein [Marvinbryantia formatexigens]UWO25851.1 hypothetical protein NQ534_05095 [Marvinbryantia formatexigens DSM 14469]SDF40143.1 Glycosyl hydrolase family 3 N terminal domain-containing protein [Marvinbryantia formatexigens]
MKHSRLWTGLSSLCSFLLVLSLVGMDCMMGYAGTVNQALGIQTSKDAVMNHFCEIPEGEAMEAKGVHAGAKHCTGNDQENNREGIAVFFNEQAFREGALAVVGGQTVMHGFNRLGFVWCSSSTELCTQVLENEWGVTGQ